MNKKSNLLGKEHLEMQFNVIYHWFWQYSELLKKP